MLCCVVQVSWSYTYTRPGYTQKRHQIAPKDWWTEDISELDIELFRCIATAVRSTYMLPPQLIGEALHVYACRWLPDITKTKTRSTESSSGSQTQTDAISVGKNRRILETIVSMIPSDRGSVSVGFLLRLLSTAIYLGGVSPVTKTELRRRASIQFEEATVGDLLLPSHSPSDNHHQYIYDIDLVMTVLESYLVLWRRQSPGTTPAESNNQFLMSSIRKVAKIIDSYLQVVARDINVPVMKLVSLAETLPAIARGKHDDLYKFINIYLKVRIKMKQYIYIYIVNYITN